MRAKEFHTKGGLGNAKVDQVYTQMVPCGMAKSGLHPVSIGVDNAQRIIKYLVSGCPNTAAIDAANRLGAQSCIEVVRRVRAGLLTTGDQSFKIEVLNEFPAFSSLAYSVHRHIVSAKKERTRGRYVEPAFWSEAPSRVASRIAGFSVLVTVANGEHSSALGNGSDEVLCFRARGSRAWQYDEELILLRARGAFLKIDDARRAHARTDAYCAACKMYFKTNSSAEHHGATRKHTQRVLDGLRRVMLAFNTGRFR